MTDYLHDHLRLIGVLKRLFDIFMSFSFIFLIFPIFIILIFFVFLFDGRPVFFLQNRVGRYGADFVLLKFRTMTINSASAAGSFDIGSTSRVTKFGNFLRKSKFDELPQLINVLRGDMSLVGPRPEIRQWVNAYPELWEKVHTIRPGITDPASIIYRNEETILEASSNPEITYREKVLPHKLYLYEKYVDKRTFLGDIKIIFQTFLALFR